MFISGLHPETHEDDFRDAFDEFGPISNLQLNLDRRSGFVKGYGLVEYQQRAEAERAIAKMDGCDFLGKTIRVDWAFVGSSTMDITTGPSQTKKHRTSHQ